MTREQYETMTLTNLKEVAKGLGIKNISKFKKNELVEEIIKTSPNSIEKDGVILRENIAPKVQENKNTNSQINRSFNNNENIKPTNNGFVNTSNNGSVRSDDEIAKAEKQENLKEMINESNTAKGILEILENNNFGFLRCKNYLTSSDDILCFTISN